MGNKRRIEAREEKGSPVKGKRSPAELKSSLPLQQHGLDYKIVRRPTVLRSIAAYERRLFKRKSRDAVLVAKEPCFPLLMTLKSEGKWPSGGKFEPSCSSGSE